MFDSKGSVKSLQVIIDNTELAFESLWSIMAHMEGDREAKVTDTSGYVSKPVFAQNRLFVPLHEERLQKKPTLILTARTHTNPKANKKDEIRNKGHWEIDISPIIPELMDKYGMGIRRKVEFRQVKQGQPDMEADIIGRCIITIKLVGDYLTKFDSVADGVKGAPKKAMSEIHQLPAETPNFNWRVRCYASNGVDMPMSDENTAKFPNSYLQFGWSLSDIR
jgi:hypothetical protein